MGRERWEHRAERQGSFGLQTRQILGRKAEPRLIVWGCKCLLGGSWSSSLCYGVRTISLPPLKQDGRAFPSQGLPRILPLPPEAPLSQSSLSCLSVPLASEV